VSPGTTPSLCVMQVNHLCISAVIMLGKQVASLVMSAVRVHTLHVFVLYVLWPVLPYLTCDVEDDQGTLRSRLIVRIHTHGLRPFFPFVAAPSAGPNRSISRASNGAMQEPCNPQSTIHNSLAIDTILLGPRDEIPPCVM
jgi:hypothetical protein